LRVYLEASEVVDEEAANPEFIRLDVTDLDPNEELKNLKKLLNPQKKYIIILHKCGHDEGKPCSLEQLGE